MPVKGEAKIPFMWLGTWTLGGEGFGKTDLGESLQVLKKAIDYGIRHIDTAGFYAHGESEHLVSKILKKNRESLFISTKGGLIWDKKQVVLDGSHTSLQNALEESLKRLKNRLYRPLSIALARPQDTFRRECIGP